MFLRLLLESFLRQKRRKALAGVAILLGTTAVTAMLALATTIGDRIHRELAVYGANIVVTPKAADLAVNLGGVDVHPATGGAYLRESDLAKLQTIFWHNNITGISPERSMSMVGLPIAPDVSGKDPSFPAVGTFYWFNHRFGNIITGAPSLHPWWKLQGAWPRGGANHPLYREDGSEVAIGSNFARAHGLKLGDRLTLGAKNGGYAPEALVVGIVTSGDASDDQVFLNLEDLDGTHASPVSLNAKSIPLAIDADLTRIDISARTRPEDAFARQNPDTLSPHQRDLWYCRPYANSIAYQIREAIPGSDAQQVRRVEQSEGTVLSRISGLMWLVSAAALLAAGFAVSAAMATAVLERRGEIGLMRSLGAGKAAIAGLFYAESSILATAAGLGGYLTGNILAWTLGRHIFPADGVTPLFNPVLLPVIVALAVVVALAGSTPAIRSGLSSDVSNVLRGND